MSDVKNVPAEALALAWNLLTTTGEVDDKGHAVPRTHFDRRFLKSRNSLREKLMKCTEFAHAPKDKKREELTEADIAWQAHGAELPEGRAVVMERFVDSDCSLSDLEKQMVAAFAKEREEFPAVSDGNIEAFQSLTGFDLTA